MHRNVALSSLAIALAFATLAAPRALAQAANTSVGYAQVLRVDPVYRVDTVQVVDPSCLDPVRAPPPSRAAECKPHPQQVRRIVAYDVEYSYKGETYMSRLQRDPGTRLRVRVSVTPDVE
jgi:uncharacterized protein YcfJ